MEALSAASSTLIESSRRSKFVLQSLEHFVDEDSAFSGLANVRLLSEPFFERPRRDADSKIILRPGGATRLPQSSSDELRKKNLA